MIRFVGLIAAALLFLGVAGTPQPAQAACNGLAGCACTASTTPVAFGAYNMLSTTPTTSTGQIQVDCIMLLALAGSFEVRLSGGGSGDVNARAMANGASRLGYNLYTTSAYNQVWGDGTQGAVAVSQGLLGLLASRTTVTVYGRIPAGQNVASGSYTDTIIVTIVY